MTKKSRRPKPYLGKIKKSELAKAFAQAAADCNMEYRAEEGMNRACRDGISKLVNHISKLGFSE